MAAHARLYSPLHPLQLRTMLRALLLQYALHLLPHGAVERGRGRGISCPALRRAEGKQRIGPRRQRLIARRRPHHLRHRGICGGDPVLLVVAAARRHTEALLRDRLGYDEAKLERLREQGVI